MIHQKPYAMTTTPSHRTPRPDSGASGASRWRNVGRAMHPLSAASNTSAQALGSSHGPVAEPRTASGTPSITDVRPISVGDAVSRPAESSTGSWRCRGVRPRRGELVVELPRLTTRRRTSVWHSLEPSQTLAQKLAEVNPG